ncbi:MAG: hypothetical protein HQL29_05190, partial [Candidatus Omnitrophica bacterium]|nr:hypothetical protein [Candidatus Omnitrophota bacterium]
MSVTLNQLSEWIDKKFPGQANHKKNCALPESFRPFEPKRTAQKYCSPRCSQIAGETQRKSYKKTEKLNLELAENRRKERLKWEKENAESIETERNKMQAENEYKSRLLIST